MKRAAISVLMIAALVVLVSPSALLPDASSCYASPSKSTAGAGAIVPGNGDGVEPGGSQGGGSNQGDADGLSGMGGGGSGKVTIEQGLAPSQSVDRLMILVGMWWKFMIWVR